MKDNQPVPKRINTGPTSSEVVYSLPFNKENFQKLWEMRRDNHIRFNSTGESGKKVQVRNQLTPEDTIKLFTENDFEYLRKANYLSISEKEEIRIKAEGELLAPRLTAEERHASIVAQQNLSDKQKMASYQ